MTDLSLESVHVLAAWAGRVLAPAADEVGAVASTAGCLATQAAHFGYDEIGVAFNATAERLREEIADRLRHDGGCLSSAAASFYAIDARYGALSDANTVVVR